MRKQRLHRGQVGDFWPGKRKGRDRADDPYCIFWLDRRARQTRSRSLGTTDWEEACKLVREQAYLADRPAKSEREDLAISKCLDVYWRDYGCETISARGLEASLAEWSAYWGDRTVSELTKTEQIKFRKWLSDNSKRGQRSPSSIDKILSAGRAALNFAVENDMLLTAPKIFLIETEDEKLRREPLATPIHPEEAARLFDAVKSRHLMMFLMIALHTVSRPCAIYDMQRKQYDSRNGVIHLNPAGRRQTKKHRPSVLVTPSLKPWLESVEDPDGFYITRGGVRVKSLRTALDNARREAGLPIGYAGYSFRHGVARWMKRQGVLGSDISYYLGHLPQGPEKITKIYAPDLAEHYGEAMRAIEAYMAEVRRHSKRANFDDPMALSDGSLEKSSMGHLTDAARSRLLEMLRQGTHVREIAEKLNVSSCIVYSYRKKLRLC